MSNVRRSSRVQTTNEASFSLISLVGASFLETVVLWSRPRLPTSHPEGKPPLRR
jgi:hypothetical protein